LSDRNVGTDNLTSYRCNRQLLEGQEREAMKGSNVPKNDSAKCRAATTHNFWILIFDHFGIRTRLSKAQESIMLSLGNKVNEDR
jgi:hypothetical protein